MNEKPIFVFIPTYNEEESIERVISGLKELKLNLKICVIDDGSTDKTAERAKKAGADVVKHPINLGGGGALRTAFALGVLNNIEYIVTLDGDGQHDPNDLSKLIEVAEGGIDLVIGSRFLKKQKQEMPLYRLLGIKFFSWLIKKSIKMKLSDATSGFRLYKTEIISNTLPRLTENQYYGIEAIIRMAKNKARIMEVPIASRTRRKGKSKKGTVTYGYHLLRTLIKSLIWK